MGFNMRDIYVKDEDPKKEKDSKQLCTVCDKKTECLPCDKEKCPW